jgi:hypothetical protein
MANMLCGDEEAQQRNIKLNILMRAVNDNNANLAHVLLWPNSSDV